MVFEEVQHLHCARFLSCHNKMKPIYMRRKSSHVALCTRQKAVEKSKVVKKDFDVIHWRCRVCLLMEHFKHDCHEKAEEPKYNLIVQVFGR